MHVPAPFLFAPPASHLSRQLSPRTGRGNPAALFHPAGLRRCPGLVDSRIPKQNLFQSARMAAFSDFSKYSGLLF